MRLGATLVHLSDGLPFDIGSWAQRLVSAGFESLWTPHIVGRGTLVPDPFVTLAVAATVTADIEIGTATVQLALYQPADLAHRVLSLQAVCGNRLTLGISPGSTRDDFVALERDYHARFETFHRNATRLRVLLTEGRDDGAILASGPARRPPPLLLGSWGANVHRAAREYDGWLAAGTRRTPDQILAAHDRFRSAGGRRAIVCAVPARRREELDATAAALRRFAAAGFDDAVVLLDPNGPTPEEVRSLLPNGRRPP